MAEGQLRCNLQTCRKILEDNNALITSCSHIFCYQHGQVSISNETCLACGTKFKSKLDFSVSDLRPSDQVKSMMLSGLNPDQVLEIANRSISFYTYQLFNENRLKDEMLKRDKEEFENLRSYCGSLKAKYKTDIEKFQRSTLGLKKELDDKISELEKQREQICQYSRLSKKLQLELAACKRQIVTLKTNHNRNEPKNSEYFAPQNFDFNFRPEGNSNDNRLNNFSDGCPSILTTKWPHARYSD